ncbi:MULTISPECIES: ClpXP protease specificity-enhancing factor [Vibrio]|uniref:Stringent starvation protein B n=2 Tax=Vibrio TaxID=662 RepID=A0A7X4RT36_9VIBR|nr:MULTISPECIES: ClpXP protease specificity-enhancing factor [Vibrio]MBF9001516.1 ClpXP protease specificity-enhancing factor [Vibrio nitrifigilis]MZI91810.1 ClpXP protease specificity-enhancing factor [Vibrio eleionomae]
MDIEQMTPRRPFMLRAFYDWLLENDLTPHLVVDATLNGVQVPLEYVQDGQIILNVAPRAVGNLQLGNDEVTFNARFGGRPHVVIVPLYAVQAIYARENGAGTMFEPEPAYMEQLEAMDELEQDEANSEESISLVSDTMPDSEDSNEDGSSDPDDEPPRPKGRPSLRVVK